MRRHAKITRRREFPGWWCKFHGEIVSLIKKGYGRQASKRHTDPSPLRPCRARDFGPPEGRSCDVSFLFASVYCG
jgi:hypothetical protein